MNTESTAPSIPDLRRALASAPTAEGHARLGTALLKAGNTREAERELRAALELDPKFAGAWVNLGGILLARWEFAAAIEANRKAAEAEPALALAHFNQAICHLHLGEPQNAVDCLSKAIEVEPRHGAAYYHLAIALYALDRPVEAQACVAFSQELGFRPSPVSAEALQQAEEAAKAAAGVMAEPPSIELQPKASPSQPEGEKNGSTQGQ
jgi:tetratricopeptide (TPR) repeat protein